MTPESTPLVTVLPCDREAAAHLFRRYNGSGSLIEGAILSGAYDHDERVQIVARHRLAALEEAAKVADEVERMNRWAAQDALDAGDEVAAAKHTYAANEAANLATAIRSLSQPVEGSAGASVGPGTPNA